MNINSIILSGNLVNDLEVRQCKEFLVADFILANNVTDEKTNFIKCTLFGENRIKALEKYLIKGCSVIVQGEIDIKTIERDEVYNTYVSVIIDKIQITKFKETEEKTTYKKKYKK